MYLNIVWLVPGDLGVSPGGMGTQATILWIEPPRTWDPPSSQPLLASEKITCDLNPPLSGLQPPLSTRAGKAKLSQAILELFLQVSLCAVCCLYCLVSKTL
jgi:hypothetical protein